MILKDYSETEEETRALFANLGSPEDFSHRSQQKCLILMFSSFIVIVLVVVTAIVTGLSFAVSKSPKDEHSSSKHGRITSDAQRCEVTSQVIREKLSASRPAGTIDHFLAAKVKFCADSSCANDYKLGICEK